MPKLRRAFGVPGEGSAAEVLAAAVAGLDEAGLRRLAAAHLRSGVATAATLADHILGWLGCSPPLRVEHFPDLCRAFHTAKGEPLKTLLYGGKKADPGDLALAQTLCEAVTGVARLRDALEVVEVAARHLRVGARLGAAYAEHKARAGVIDYDDMIARAAALLKGDAGAAAWVRYKLDQRIDHLLVDEAQDTNEAQWDIVGALTDEFFAGEGAREAVRTLFVVGDFKQAIFSFQGSDPRIFAGRHGHFRDLAADAQRDWRDLPMTVSFRSVPAVLEVVDAVVDDLGPAAFGMTEPIPPHEAHRQDVIGRVTLWPPLIPEDGAADDGDEDAPWLPAAQVQMAQKLARQIAAWLDLATPLDLPARGRACRPEDILVLVRSRGEFVGALVAALHDRRVPVAGVDRLRLTAPLAVQDCLALVRFALQPDDDLTCAALLTSPFIGLDQEALFALAFERRGTLWSAVRDAGGPVREFLDAVLALADFSAPYEFLEQILSGPLQGRAKLLARLGEEARDQVAALLGEALAFERANAPSLQGFLAWVETDDIDLKRDPDAPVDAVRIMTVHGAKGLQAPVVILADATRPPARDASGQVMLRLDPLDEPVPIFHGGKGARIERIAREVETAAKEAREEHWRLLYVAMTRAEDLLFVGGALGVRDKGVVPPDSWYAAIARAMTATWDYPAEEVPLWGSATVHRAGTIGLPEAAPAPPPAARRCSRVGADGCTRGGAATATAEPVGACRGRRRAAPARASCAGRGPPWPAAPHPVRAAARGRACRAARISRHVALASRSGTRARPVCGAGDVRARHHRRPPLRRGVRPGRAGRGTDRRYRRQRRRHRNRRPAADHARGGPRRRLQDRCRRAEDRGSGRAVSPAADGGLRVGAGGDLPGTASRGGPALHARRHADRAARRPARRPCSGLTVTKKALAGRALPQRRGRISLKLQRSGRRTRTQAARIPPWPRSTSPTTVSPATCCSRAARCWSTFGRNGAGHADRSGRRWKRSTTSSPVWTSSS